MTFFKITNILCGFGILKEFRPSEPFLSPFLYGPKNFTDHEITTEIYPVGTYSNMLLIIIVFLLTDWLRYKPILIVQGASGFLTWSLVTWGTSVSIMQIGQISYGLFSACDVAFFSYLYAKVDKKEYQKATAHAKTAILISKFSSGLIAQFLIMYQVLDFVELNYLTLAALFAATIWGLFLPSVSGSVYFNRKVVKTPDSLEGNTENVFAEEEGFLKHPIDPGNESYSLLGIYGLWREAMRNSHTVKWSVWAALSSCGYLQVTYYIQLLWQQSVTSDVGNTKIYHGFSNSFNSLAGALCAYAVGFVTLDWSKYGEIALAGATLAQGILLIYASLSEPGLIVHYIVYCAFKLLYQVSSIIAFAEIGKSLNSESYGLVFGSNQFFALVEQSILTLTVTKIFDMNIKMQFVLYGAYFVTIGIGYAVASVISSHSRHRPTNMQELAGPPL